MYEFDALIRASRLSMLEASRRLGRNRRWLYSRKAKGLSFDEADELAGRLGFLPYEIWPEWLEESQRLAAEEIEAQQRIEQERAERRRERQRRYAQRRRQNPEYREKQRAYQEQYRADYRDGLNAYARQYYQRHREQLIRAAVERKRAAARAKRTQGELPGVSEVAS